MKKIKLFHFLLLAGLLIFSCQPKGEKFPAPDEVTVSWELITNFTGVKDEFEAEFTMVNKSDFTFNDHNWALFFNIAPRPIVSATVPQPASLVQINGDWYKLVPNEHFSLKPGDTVRIRYRGTEGVIKETDGPLGPYFVFYDRDGNEEKIVELKGVDILPFTRPEQIRRNEDDRVPLPTPQERYRENLGLLRLPEKDLKSIIPTPVKLIRAVGYLEISSAMAIRHQEGLGNEAGFLAAKLKELTGAVFHQETTGTEDPAIRLNLGKVVVNGVDREAYKLEISKKGISITGSDPAGVFYGIQSLLALIPLEVYKNKAGVIAIPKVTIEDAPRFGERSLHLDVSRNFQTKETLKRIFDIMAFYKLNQFLLYTTEDEGWRLEIAGLPELTEVGGQRQHTLKYEDPVLHPAYGSGPYAYEKGKYGSGFYTREDFIELLKYAHARHIKIIPELNMPGHARAAIKSMEARYERLMAEGKEKAANEYRLVDPDDRSVYLSPQGYTDDVVCVARESTYRFYEKVVDEIAEMYRAAGLKMDVVHTGGDEVAEGAWTKSPLAEKLLKEHPEIGDPHNLQAYFFKTLLQRLKKRGLRVDGWEEVALIKNAEGKYEPNPEFAADDVVAYVWNNLSGHEDLCYRLANYGYRVVLCPVSNYYFDLAYSNDPKEPGLYWAGFIKTRNAWGIAPYDMFRTITQNAMGWKIDPEKDFTDMVRLKPGARKNIIGVEAQLWSETIKGRKMVEYYLLPKLIGFAESAWGPERKWEVIPEKEMRDQVMASDWNVFANTLAQKELPRLSYINGGYNYRIPLPGAVVEGGVLKANVEFPGLTIRYTTDGSDPDSGSRVYEGPVKVTGMVKLRSFDASGRNSRISVIKP